MSNAPHGEDPSPVDEPSEPPPEEPAVADTAEQEQIGEEQEETAEADAPAPDSAAKPAVEKGRPAERVWSFLRGQIHAGILLALLAFTLVVRIATLPMIERGGDAVRAWFNAKQLTLGITEQFWQWDHHSVRFAIIVPVWIAQEVLGLHPTVYYVVPLVWSCTTAALLYAVGRRLGRPEIGLLAAMGVVLFPQMERNGAQILSESPSGMYAVLGLYIVLRYRDAVSRRAQLLMVIALSTAMFLGYLTKLTNVLFVPGFALAVWLYRRSWKDTAIFLGVLFAMFCIETMLYRVLTEHSLGQLSIVRGSHLKDRRLKPTELKAFFTHFLDLVFWWKVVLGAFLASVIVAFAGWKRFGKDLAVVAILGLSFIVLQNFAVKSIDPLVPVQRFLPRYLLPPLPLMMLTIAGVGCLAAGWVGARIGKKTSFRLPAWAPAAAALMTLTVAGWAAWETFYVGKEKHPLTLISRWEKEANQAYERGTPIVGNKTAKEPDLFLKMFWKGMRGKTFKGEMPRIRKFYGGKRRQYWFVIHPKMEKKLKGVSDREILRKFAGKKVVLMSHRWGYRKHYREDMGSLLTQKMFRLPKKL